MNAYSLANYMEHKTREICDVVFRAKSTQKIGNATFYAGQPVLLIDTAKTSTIEGDSETTYATGGRGNPNLIAWDGSKSITFTVEDALFSPIGLSILMGADIAETNNTQQVHVHKMVKVEAKTVGSTVTLDLSSLVGVKLTASSPYYEITQQICSEAPLYVIPVEEDGSIKGEYATSVTVSAATATVNTAHTEITSKTQTITGGNLVAGTTYLVDCYVIRNSVGVTEIQVRKDKFAGYFYVEAETLYRRQDTGADLPAVITIPKVKIQSNFSFSMSADGDPSTATFTMDAFPDYTYFDKTKEVLCVIQVVDDNDVVTEEVKSVMLHDADTEQEGNVHPSVLKQVNGVNYGFADSTRDNGTTGKEKDFAYDDN